MANSVKSWWLNPTMVAEREDSISLHQLMTTKSLLYENLIPGTLELSVCVIGHSSVITLTPNVRRRDVKRIGILEASDTRLPRRTEKLCMNAAATIHETLGAFGVTKTDFVIDPNGDAWALETDAHPGLGERVQQLHRRLALALRIVSSSTLS